MERPFKKEQLITSKFQWGNKPRSIPLVLPSNFTYNKHTGEIIPTGTALPGIDFHFVEDALNLLESLPGPVAVVSIIGPYRSGKSYFLSRLLGDEKTFKVGHTVEPCTFGIWLATTTFKSQEFSLLVLDTEGADNPLKTECSCGSKINILFALILHISSMVIYNSKNIPRQADIKKISFLAGVSSKLGKNLEEKHLPSLLWLLRDVEQQCRLQGKSVSATEYVLTNLQNSKGENKMAACNLLKHFPSLQCHTLPRNPNSGEDEAVCDPTHPFEKNLQSVIHHIFNSVSAKKTFTGNIDLTGPSLALSIRKFFELMSKSSDIPTLERSWSAMIDTIAENKLEAVLDNYEKQMNDELLTKPPLDFESTRQQDETLYEIHKKVYKENESVLVSFLSAYNCSEELKKNIIEQFSTKTANWDETVHPQILVGGHLLKFVSSNKRKSKAFCTKLYERIYNNCVTPKILEIRNTSIARDFSREIEQLRSEYFQQAKGPAKEKQFESCRIKSQHVEEQIKMLPGPLEDMDVVKVTANTVELSWKKPTINSASVKRYLIRYSTMKEEIWHECQVKVCSITVRNLKSNSQYFFAVFPRNDKHVSTKFSYAVIRTKSMKIVKAAAIIASPISYPIMTGYLGIRGIILGAKHEDELTGMSGGVLLGLSPLAGLIGLIPVFGQLAAYQMYSMLNYSIDISGTITENARPMEIVDVPSDDETDHEVQEQDFDDAFTTTRSNP